MARFLSLDDYLLSPDVLVRGQLLRRDPQKRLGSGPSGVQEIMDQPFFQSIDWEKLKVGQVKLLFVNVDEIYKLSNEGAVQSNSSPSDFLGCIPKSLAQVCRIQWCEMCCA